MATRGKIVAVCTSSAKGEKKQPQAQVRFEVDRGLLGDAHSGSGRQVSLLALESIEEIRRLGIDVAPGDFAENITTAGVELHTLPIGEHLCLGEEVVLEITQIGKACLHPCEIFRQVGTCAMPTKGIFAKVLQGGEAAPGDLIEVKENG